MRAKAVIALAAVVAGTACGAPSADVRAELCRDMGNLRATVEDLASTPDDGRIGEVRGGLEKLDPTFGHVSSSGLVPEDILQPLLQAHVGYRDSIWYLGDDETYRAVPPEDRATARDLLTAYERVVAELGC